MFLRILKYTVLLLATYLWLQAYSPVLYKWSRLFPDDYRHGDLYHLSYLPQFKEKLKPCVSSKKNDSNPLVNLFVIGDSFTEPQRVNKNDINAVNYVNVHWNDHIDIQLDRNKKNILILETVERTFKNHFSEEINNFIVNATPLQIEQKKSWKVILKEKYQSAITFLFPDKDEIEQRFEATLFSYDIFLKFRELKSTINYQIFGRIEKKVVLSKDKQSIFFSEESVPTDSHSAFFPFTDNEKTNLIYRINHTREKYIKEGFDEVYLSIIPNKVSIISPDLDIYNHLINRIQIDSSLKTPIIDTYTDFRKNPLKYYLKSDSHWNCEGRDVWLNKVNKILLTQ